MESERKRLYTRYYHDNEATMMKRETGFSLVELLIVIFILGFVLAAGSDMFVGLLRGYKQQSKITETSIEGIVGLELLRRDIESAGYGLPWIVNTSYQEVEATNATAATYNDATTNPPRAIVSGDNLAAAGIVNGSDYLVIKAINVARNIACTKWTNLPSTGVPTPWIPATEELEDTDRVILISPGSTAANSRTLVSSGAFSAIKAMFSAQETRIIYGVDPANNLRMPFNRADYYVSTTVTIPGRCAPGTGVLVKAIVQQNGGGFRVADTLPLLDCVADMQVSYGLDRDGDGTIDDSAVVLNDLAAVPLTAQQIRAQLKQVRVYILSHEGQRDPGYMHQTSPMLVGESAALGRNFVVSAISNWQNYRWKVYTLVVTPINLR